MRAIILTLALMITSVSFGQVKGTEDFKNTTPTRNVKIGRPSSMELNGSKVYWLKEDSNYEGVNNILDVAIHVLFEYGVNVDVERMDAVYTVEYPTEMEGIFKSYNLDDNTTATLTISNEEVLFTVNHIYK